jgi:alkanesulfonate monooxygenase SsuD/methylene tetrahydromethanopterin reductase-like flavin-dependent oxidoreductase (luciferase family)
MWAFEERWKRFDEVVQLLRSLLRPDAPPFRGQFYASAIARLEVPVMTNLEPFLAQEAGPPIWIGS